MKKNKKMVKVEFFQESEDSFLSLRVLLSMEQAGKLMAYIGTIPNKIPLKPKSKKITDPS